MEASAKISKFGIRTMWTCEQACPSTHDHPKNKKEDIFSDKFARLSDNML